MRSKEEIFAEVKFQIAQIQFNELKLSSDGEAIEANPSTHRIAEYVCNLLDEYASEVLREELIKFCEYRENNHPYSAVINFQQYVDTYLKTK